MDIANVIALLGGLGFFLFGMTLLGDGLKRVAGRKLETILARLTSTTIRGVMLGALVTAVIQSSSATTVMVVGFVNSGIMQLRNAIGIIMGANIGTTATGWILTLAGVEGKGGFSSATMFALIAFIGIIFYFFCKDNTKQSVGMIMLAFSVLMSGMQSMSGAMAPLKESEAFLHFITAVSNPLLSLLVGIVVTAIIQSCSASIGILQALAVTGVIHYDVALPMVLGMCIGACVPVLLSAIGANVNGKRAAFIYLYFNLAGTLLLMIPFYILNAVLDFSFMSAVATSTGIAVLNTVFKVLATLLLAPLAGQMEKLACTTIREKEGEVDETPEDDLLDARFLAYPSVALEQCSKTMEKMCAEAFENLRQSIELMDEFDQEKYNRIEHREDRVDRYEDCLSNYLVKLNVKALNNRENQESAKMLRSLSNLERISDHAMNLAELGEELSRKHVAFSEEAMAEMRVCIDAMMEIAELSRFALLEDDLEVARQVEPLEEVIDVLTETMKGRHIQRVQNGDCTLELGFIFNDYVNNIERVSDHCSNLAIAVLEMTDHDLQPHDYPRVLKNDEVYLEWLRHYEEKYCTKLLAEGN